MRDTTAVDIDALIEEMIEYYQECVIEFMHDRWRWVVHPRILYEIKKMRSGPLSYGNPPSIPYGKSDMKLFGIPIVCSPLVRDVELEEVHEGHTVRPRS